MKKSIKMMMTSLFAACMMFSRTAFSVCAAESSGNADNTLSYEDCLRMAEVLNVDVNVLYETRAEQHTPTYYIAYVSAKGNYTSGSVVMGLNYDTIYLTHAGTSGGSHGSVTSSSTSITSGTWMSCTATATLGSTTTDPKPSSVVFTHNFTVPAAYAENVRKQHDPNDTTPLTCHTIPQITFASIGGATISNYSDYFEIGFKALGDVNNDTYVGQDDVNLILKYLAGQESFDNEQLAAADVTQDGIISVTDAVALYYLW